MLVRICLLRLYCTDLNYGVIKQGFSSYVYRTHRYAVTAARRIKHLQYSVDYGKRLLVVV
jgi:hypothetical protein